MTVPSDDAGYRREGVIDQSVAEAMTGILDLDDGILRNGLPVLWHWLYLLDRPAQRQLGPDGHPTTGTVVAPPVDGMRRMWAGGRVFQSRPLEFGETAARTSRVLRRTTKVGRSGDLHFVVVEHSVSQRGRVVIREEQDIVYRAPTGVPSQPEPARSDAGAGNDAALGGGAGWRIRVDPLLLFRFSALTYNAHRIHWDRDYATQVEGFDGLVVHGPLQAMAMATAVAQAGGRGALDVDYRMTSPLHERDGMTVETRATPAGWASRIVDDRGRSTAQAMVRQHDG